MQCYYKRKFFIQLFRYFIIPGFTASLYIYIYSRYFFYTLHIITDEKHNYTYMH